MIKSLKSLFVAIAGVGTLLTPVAIPVLVHAQADLRGNLCAGTNLDTTNKTCVATDDQDEGINAIIALVINVFSVIVGFIAVVMIIYGGFKYITSSGDSGNVTSAKNTIMYALIGLVIVALAQVLVRFVISKTTATGIGA